MKNIFKKIENSSIYRFRKFLNIFGLDITNAGERVVIDYNKLNIDKMDMYQRAHYERYLYAKKFIVETDDVADMACGTGYGSVIISEIAKKVTGFDIKSKVVEKISKKYSKIKNVSFKCSDLLVIKDDYKFDKIISFETIEHLPAEETIKLFIIFHDSLKTGGKLIFSIPYMQEESESAKKMGFHLIFNIDNNTILNWLSKTGFVLEEYHYQNYKTFSIADDLQEKDFIICVAKKL